VFIGGDGVLQCVFDMKECTIKPNDDFSLLSYQPATAYCKAEGDIEVPCLVSQNKMIVL